MNQGEPPPFQEWIEDHVFTPSELESYLSCPFYFYARSYLKLEPETEWEVEMTPAETGQILHRVLERFVRQKTGILSLLNEEIEKFRGGRPNLSTVLLEIQQKKMERTLLSFIAKDLWESSPKQNLAPRFLEWSFGKNSPPLQIAGNPPIRIQGRIDRIDVDEKSKRFLVIDYKTGSRQISGNQIRTGLALQLPLYILAVQRLLLPGYEPIGGLYYQLSDMTIKDGLLHAGRYAESLADSIEIGPRSSSLVPASKWDETFLAIEEAVRSVVSEIRKGIFPSEPEPCESYCPYRDICRIRSATTQLEDKFVALSS